MIEKLFCYLQGYLILELCGESKERFINLCKNKEIEILQIFMINNKWFCKMKCRDFLKIKSFIKKTGCLCKIVKKHGLPFFLRKVKARKGLIIGSVLFYIILSQCSDRIWSISVDGGFIHTREQILQVMAEELGVYGGIYGSQVDCFEIEKKLKEICDILRYLVFCVSSRFYILFIEWIERCIKTVAQRTHLIVVYALAYHEVEVHHMKCIVSILRTAVA